MPNRINSSATISLDGGAFSFVSRSGVNDTIQLGPLALSAGNSDIRVNVGSSGLGTATVNFQSLASRSDGCDDQLHRCDQCHR